MLYWHLAYVEAFSDPAIRETIRNKRDRLIEKGIFSAVMEASAEE